MLSWVKEHCVRPERGDTLIEVTFALSILSFVLLGSTALASTAFRIGQTAKERSQVADAAQQQMEALRSFRDNHSWSEFQNGSPGVYYGINTVPPAACNFNPLRVCFHMEPQPTTAGTTEYVPIAGSTNANVPTSIIEISAVPNLAAQQCGYDFELHYTFTVAGGGNSGSNSASNQIETRLVNLKGPVGPVCP
jgi:Tfp pilus assembly protein PilV